MPIATPNFAYDAELVSKRTSRALRAPSLNAEAFAPRIRGGAISAQARRDLFRAVLFVVGALLALIAFALPVRAAGGTHVLVIPADDGYGLSDCLTEDASCGPIVASAWCKAQGHGAAGTFGPIAAASTATDAPQPAGLGARSFAITCHE